MLLVVISIVLLNKIYLFWNCMLQFLYFFPKYVVCNTPCSINRSVKINSDVCFGNIQIAGQSQSPRGSLASISTRAFLMLKDLTVRIRAESIGLIIFVGVPTRSQPHQAWPVHWSDGWAPQRSFQNFIKKKSETLEHTWRPVLKKSSPSRPDKYVGIM